MSNGTRKCLTNKKMVEEYRPGGAQAKSMIGSHLLTQKEKQ